MNNPNYIPIDQHNRHRVIDTIITDSLEALHEPTVRDRIGSRALELTESLQYTSVPNVHHGEIISTSDADDKLEIITLGTHEAAHRRLSDMLFNAAQRQTILDLLGPENATTLYDYQKYAYDNNTERSMRLDSFADLDMSARVVSPMLPRNTMYGKLHMVGRPLVIFNHDTPVEYSPIFSLHEMTHALQKNEYPLIEPDANLEHIHIEEELEAYYVSAQTILGLHQSQLGHVLTPSFDDLMLKRMLHINEIRETHQTDTNPFRPNDTIIAALEEHNLALTHTTKA